MRKLTQEEAERRLKELGSEYKFLPFAYKGLLSPITGVCKKHGAFPTSVGKISQGYGCPKCGVERAHDKTRRTQEEFINIVKEKFKDRPLDFSESIYNGAHTHITYRCLKHGYITLYPYQLMNSHYGCEKCSYEERGLNIRITYNDFVSKSRATHGDKFDYSKANVIDYDTPVEIICKKHGSFWQSPDNHIHGCGCTFCRESKGERGIAEWLDSHNILYKREYFITPTQVLFGRNKFRVDFYLPNDNMIIEFHGRQHYENTQFYKRSEEDFQEQLDRDRRLREYCKQHGITLIEIPYTKIKEIDKILDKKIGKSK